MSSDKCTPVSKYNASLNLGSAISESTCVSSIKSSGKISKTLLTPCRRVGLKRKSMNNIERRQLLKDFSVAPCTSDDAKKDFNTKQMLHSNQFICHTEIMSNQCDGKNEYSSDTLNRVIIRHRSSDTRMNTLNVSDKKETISDSALKPSINTGYEFQSHPDNITVVMLEQMAISIKEKKEKYKHIKLTNLYEKKHDLQALRELTKKWKLGCQSALVDLHKLLENKGHTLSMSQLLAQFQIPHDVLSYNEDSDDFE